MLKLIPIFIKRVPLPPWYLEMDGHTEKSNDWTDGRLDEIKTIRESQMNLFGRLCNYWPVKMELLAGLANMFD